MKKVIILTISLLSILCVIVIALLVLNKHSYQKAYLNDGNIFISDITGNDVRQITADSTTGKGIKYGAPNLSGDDVYYIKCNNSYSFGDNNTCQIVKFNIITNKTIMLFSLENINYLASRSIAWNSSNNSLVFASQDHLYMFIDGKLNSLMEWKVLDLGMGGGFCSETRFNSDYSYFYFCDASAVGLSIQGNLYLFKASGEKVKEFTPSVAKSKLGIINPAFTNAMLTFSDSTNNTNYLYNISEDKITQTN